MCVYGVMVVSAFSDYVTLSDTQARHKLHIYPAIKHSFSTVLLCLSVTLRINYSHRMNVVPLEHFPSLIPICTVLWALTTHLHPQHLALATETTLFFFLLLIITSVSSLSFFHLPFSMSLCTFSSESVLSRAEITSHLYQTYLCLFSTPSFHQFSSSLLS